MEKLSVAAFKSNFSSVIERVKSGGEVEILYGRAKVPVARVTPIPATKKGGLLGCLKGKASFSIGEDWKMTGEELIEL
ncbi:MAG: hypothetical protein LBK04_05130 [Clostridiales Family XIII bacterium]|nr:hypothetical protein [Clostridiales Family XIII bacterium]